jgi:hypothetical protein
MQASTEAEALAPLIEGYAYISAACGCYHLCQFTLRAPDAVRACPNFLPLFIGCACPAGILASWYDPANRGSDTLAVYAAPTDAASTHDLGTARVR